MKIQVFSWNLVQTSELGRLFGSGYNPGGMSTMALDNVMQLQKVIKAFKEGGLGVATGLEIQLTHEMPTAQEPSSPESSIKQQASGAEG